MHELITLVAAYLVGCINPAYFIGRIKGIDVKKVGSKNAGGSNALITMGAAIGVLCIVFDFGKAFGIIKLMMAVFPESPLIYCCAATGVILGHSFPFYLRFNGGKGFACFGGCVLAFNPIVFLIMLGVEVFVLLGSGYLCIVSITSTFAFPIIYGIMTKNVAGALILAASMYTIPVKHIENLKRIRTGDELRISWLWNKEKEIERLNVDVEAEREKGQIKKEDSE